MLISLSGVIFAASTPKSDDNVRVSNVRLVPATLQALQPIPTANEESTPTTPEWAKKLHSEVADIKRTQEHIFAILQSQNRRVKVQDFATAEEAVQANTSPRKRDSFFDFDEVDSVGADSCDNMTPEQKEAACITRINANNQQRADRQREGMAMGIAAQESFREERHGDSDCDLESDSGDLFASPLNERPKTGNLAGNLRHRVFSTRDSGDLLASSPSERPQTGNLAGDLRHRVLSERDPNIEDEALMPHPPSAAGTPEKPRARGSSLLMETVTFTSPPAVAMPGVNPVLQSADRSERALLNGSFTGLPSSRHK